jgi:2-iminobutanoate/2-iminopropanoate deaminase
MNKLITTIKLAKGPKAIGPYSVGKIFNGMAYLSGQIGFNPETNALVSESIEDQTHQIMKNVSAILSEANSSLENIIKCTVYLTVSLG